LRINPEPVNYTNFLSLQAIFSDNLGLRTRTRVRHFAER